MFDQPIRFATFLAPNMYPVYQFIATYIAEKLGCRTELMTGSSFDQFAAGQVDVGFICGLPYVLLARQAPPPVELLAAPVLAGERYQDRPLYFSDVIVHQNNPAQSFADLRGCTWAYNDPDSHSGYNITRYQLIRMGQTHGYFGRVIAAGWHQRAIRLVCEGEIDAAAIDSQVLAIELRDHPELATDLRIIDTLGPAAIQPVVAASRLPDGLKADLRAVLLAMDHDPSARAWLGRGLIKRFAPVSDANYDDIREMLAAAEAAGFMTLK
ncbi:MAG: PhnD/SsuA/transferrin family substrate-binding protein [Chloroflexota bacterium]